MRERERQPSSPPPDAECRSWDVTAIAAKLGAHAEPRLDPLHGKGARVSLGELPLLDLELFPTTQIVRLSAPDFSLNLVQEVPPKLAASGVVFEAPEHNLSIASSGSVGRNLQNRPQTPLPVSNSQ